MKVEPNIHGVYPEDAAEQINWPAGHPRYGIPSACIHLLNVDGAWLSSIHYMLSCQGGGGPLMKKTRLPGFSSRADALADAARELIRRVGRNDSKAAIKMVEWAHSLTAVPVQRDLFAEAA